MQQTDQMRGPLGLTPIDPAQLATPIDYLHAVHLREREACAILDRIADLGHTSAMEAMSVLAFLSDELSTHLEDEEMDLFPLLQKRCTEEDDIDRLLQKLCTDHRRTDFDTPRVTAILKDATYGIDHAACSELRRFADHARRHLILENAILLPFARLRLTERDIGMLQIAMTQRRGLDFPSGAHHARRPS